MSYKKLSSIVILVAALILSVCSCDMIGLPSKPTEQPTTQNTEGSLPTQALTDTPTEAPTQMPTDTPTEAPTQTPTESSTEAPTESETDTEYHGRELREDIVNYTVELTTDEYSTTDNVIRFVIKGKTPGQFVGRGDKWELFKLVNGEKVYVGGQYIEIALEISAPSDTECVYSVQGVAINNISGASTLEEGEYCLDHIVESSGTTYAVASLRFTVVDKT